MSKRKKPTTTKNSGTQLHTRHKNTCKHTKFPGFVQNLHGRVQTATCTGAHWVFKRISCSIHTSFHQGLAASCRWVLLGVAAGARMFSSLLPYSPCTAQARGPQNQEIEEKQVFGSDSLVTNTEVWPGAQQNTVAADSVDHGCPFLVEVLR